MEKRRKKIVAAFAVFLAFMWLCTLVSKSIYVSQLPIVQVTRTETKYIEHIVEAEGIVEAGAKLPVTALGGLRVESLAVQAGDSVEEGDLLFTVDLEDLRQLMGEQELAAAKVQLQIDTLAHNEALAKERKALEEERAREDYDALARYQDTLVGRAAEDLVQAEKALEELQDAGGASESEEERLRKELQAAAYAEADARWNRDNTIKEADRKVEDVVQEEDADATLAVWRTELAAAKEQIAAYRAILEQEGKIGAPMGGLVTDVFVQTGGRVPDTASFLLADDTVPCQFRVALTKEQKSYVNLNDGVKLELDGYAKIDAKIDHIEESEMMPGSYTAIVSLPEATGMPGLSGKLTCAKSGERQPACISLTALHEEGGRKFVYTVSEREGILGAEYYVEEITVYVADQNDRLAAIEGPVTAESLIVESSTKEIQKGDVVRLAGSP
ncbi:MAG: efflux RND transporter periplasmic adaptor subunit [Bacteroidales bacterium]|nr:efflux RND transporter periplasmic adaptor subunit [Bacteroidales bacterium]MCM1416021.1 efflux RND transporter periplasmic adaptor subunit [bacterium]MCM1423832.1 efflux RND transporter periplasmic adaptor subunit [bacterium]